MEVEIISRELIRPAAFQRDQDQKTFQLSLLDIYIGVETYTPIILFYSTKKNQSNNNENTISSLKLSLSKTLARFPMLAGRIKGNFVHYCSSNNGALFVEASVKTSMADFLKTPRLESLSNLIPFPDLVLKEPLETAVQVAAQVNFFSCGTGIAMGFCFLHKIIDGTTMSTFIKTWALSNEGIVEKLACGSYEASSSLFPAREISTNYNDLVFPESAILVAQQKNCSVRRFVFDALAISNLKVRAKSQSVSNPTSVEAVTCFIWKYAMKAASKCKSLVVGNGKEASCDDTKWGSLLVHIVNMRRRIQPPLSEYEVGNIFWTSCAYYEESDTDANLGNLETILRQSLLEITNDFIPKAVGEDGFETILSSLHQLGLAYYAKGSESFIFSSWCNMGLNTVNFGWNKPIWIATGGKPNESLMIRNIILLMDRASGEGIEAWITLDDETMNLLENDYEFLEFASPNPGITLD
ncbi:BAHD acyltransferase At5g47980-like isoform X2 [Momordica charantia]|uniref:BAHD acyltransferase At5g47980-like isoform X2 n=1 Tax=Momordica charantia TaxID=3673 RepID=A0A6J1D706_MOMCH|nr:BAHD acyltransferase At5g47980-like isoform X2 [Momordica charantia]